MERTWRNLRATLTECWYEVMLHFPQTTTWTNWPNILKDFVIRKTLGASIVAWACQNWTDRSSISLKVESGNWRSDGRPEWIWVLRIGWIQSSWRRKSHRCQTIVFWPKTDWRLWSEDIVRSGFERNDHTTMEKNFREGYVVIIEEQEGRPEYYLAHHWVQKGKITRVVVVVV